MEIITGILIGLFIGAGALFGILTLTGNNLIHKAKIEADKLRETAARDAEAKAKEQELKARQAELAARETFEKEQDAQRKKLTEQEVRLGKREDNLDRKADTLIAKERNIDDLEKQLTKRDRESAAKLAELDRTLAEERDKLLQITSMNIEQAREQLLKRLETEMQGECGELIRKMTEQATEEGKDRARQIILQAIQRYAADQTADHTVSSVNLGDDALKGRVIGREGRNIRAFEKTTGTDVIIDDTPGVVVVSCFDPVRREVARISLERLVQDGRIHPARIEEIHAQVAKEMEENLLKIGKDAAQQAHIHNLAKPIIPMLGRLFYRTSYGQNVLKHSLEVAFLAQVMAEELGLDGVIARRAGLLHDIGKSLDHDHEGGHPQLGMEFLQKFGESEAVLNAAAGHHGDVPATTPYTPLIMAADAISAARPGARRESLEKYIKRLRELEDLAGGFDGVRQAYAIQAGREVRVIVDAKLIDDRNSAKLARDIATNIQTKLSYPGEIKVTVLREVRTVEYAR